MNTKAPTLFFTLIFGLFFAGGGVMVFSETVWPTWQDWRVMQQWQPASAQLLEISGSDNETIANYRYKYNGVTYQGDRVYVALFKDNIGSYHADLLKRLREQKNAGQLVSIWVNPLDHQQAVIDRDMRWGLFALMCGFCSVFIFMGSLVMYAGLPGGKTKAYTHLLQTTTVVPLRTTHSFEYLEIILSPPLKFYAR